MLCNSIIFDSKYFRLSINFFIAVFEKQSFIIVNTNSSRDSFVGNNVLSFGKIKLEIYPIKLSCSGSSEERLTYVGFTYPEQPCGIRVTPPNINPIFLIAALLFIVFTPMINI